jgi:prepilin-type N-terminal cleavage/methylation domain-containing protein
MEKKRFLKNQKGFTLIEIAIVLVIIGLLIGGVLKGQSMIQNAKIKRLVKDAEGMTAAVIAFQDRYGMLPGDENSATIPTAADTTNGNFDGLITAAENPIEDLRLAGLISGTGTVLPSNAYGGTIGVSNIVVSGSPLNYNKVIATNIPAEICQEIDTKYDDGVYNTGTIRGSAAYTAGTIIPNFAWILS